jgi:two-component system LytT family response regulator
MLKAVIIDDIDLARQTLKKDLLLYCPDVEVIGEAEGVVSGVKLLKSIKPDVLFLDIQLKDGVGFDLLEILPDVSFKIIFTTASDAYAIKAFRHAAVDYLLKPIDPDELMSAIEKLKSGFSQQAQVSVLMENNRSKTTSKIALHTQDKIHVVDISDIIRCEANVNYTEFHFINSKKILVTKTLKDFEEMLKENGFYRVHQSHLINTKYIKEFVKTDGGYLIMSDGNSVPVSTRKRSEVLSLIETL